MEWGLGTPMRDPALTLVTVCISCACCTCRENPQCEEVVVSECHCAHVIRSLCHIPSVCAFLCKKAPLFSILVAARGRGAEEGRSGSLD